MNKKLQRSTMICSACEAHARDGQAYNVGLGFYTGRRFHVDSSGFRKWGADGKGVVVETGHERIERIYRATAAQIAGKLRASTRSNSSIPLPPSFAGTRVRSSCSTPKLAPRPSDSEAFRQLFVQGLNR